MTESVQKLVGMRQTGAISMSGRKFRVRILNEAVTRLASCGHLEVAGFLLEDALAAYFLRSLAAVCTSPKKLDAGVGVRA